MHEKKFQQSSPKMPISSKYSKTLIERKKMTFYHDCKKN